MNAAGLQLRLDFHRHLGDTVAPNLAAYRGEFLNARLELQLRARPRVRRKPEPYLRTVHFALYQRRPLDLAIACGSGASLDPVNGAGLRFQGGAADVKAAVVTAFQA